MFTKLLHLIVLILISNFLSLSNNNEIIPKPNIQVEKPGFFTISPNTTIHIQDSACQNIVNYFQAYLHNFYQFNLIENTNQQNGIYLQIDTLLPLSSYSLVIDSTTIVLKGGSESAVFYGIQTLIQLLPVTQNNPIQIACVSIYDAPKFEYRGMHLDVSRYFFPVAFVKQFIDYLALHKINYFHWHLSDDQGWRIEIKKYPLLTEIGAWRNGTYAIARKKIKKQATLIGNDGIRHGGFYTQTEIRDIVDYAAKRYITIIPEIEMPGHANAAIAAYPVMSCFPSEPSKIKAIDLHKSSQRNKKMILQRLSLANDSIKKVVREYWGISDDVFCAGNENTFTFLEDVLSEVMSLFPSKWIHIGGDECPKSNWNRCPKCKARMETQGLKDAHELQSYFIRRIEKFINGNGRTIIGWDEILEGGLADNAIVMSWRGEAGGIKAASANHKVIMAPNNRVYFDHPRSLKNDKFKMFFGGYIPLRKVYNWPVIPKKLAKNKQQYILGGQACVWTEYVPTIPVATSIIFPRIAALSESLWSHQDVKKYRNFRKRLKAQEQRYLLWQIKYKP
ncbi:MAG TPA: beta-N-acetylhexosaminidase [Chitinophagales bacterium]|nr:beta-N-acetylhexosaminidase [Chitinophagales bacterium]HNL56783.1 beta-N-acetylhexosaminidase [Chitinophagales bacterium]HNO01368.1 beta-N-acetylhexosaminidase [Chitinophagales bacterium]